jgi:hypothetical protein
MVQPKDPNMRHFYISIAKSMIRLVAFGILMNGDYFTAGGFLISAELLGIAEEI